MYQSEDLKQLLIFVFKHIGFSGPLNEFNNYHRDTLSKAINKQKIAANLVEVTTYNLRSYIDFALGETNGEFKGKTYNPKIEALSKWILSELNLPVTDIEKTFYNQIINHLKNTSESQSQSPTPLVSNMNLQKLSGTSWWLYCYHDEDFSGIKWEGVLKLLVEIKDPNEVIIYHYDEFFPEEGHFEVDFCSYKGKVEMHGNGDRRYLLELKHNGERDLHILLHKGEGGHSTWLTGQYHNVSRRGNIISGKILFKNNGSIGNVREEDKAVFYLKRYKVFEREYTSASTDKKIEERIKNFEELPRSVKETFARKTQSFITVPNHFTTEQIDEWNRNELSQYLNEAEVPEYEYEFFISGPASLLPDSEYKIFREKVLELKSKLETWYDCEGKVFTLFESTSIIDYASTHYKQLFESLVKNLRKSRIFIMLYHDLLVDNSKSGLTGMLIEFGYCFHDRKDCLVLWDKAEEELLPNFIRGAAQSLGSKVHLEYFRPYKNEDPLSLPLNKELWGEYLSFYGKQSQ